MVGWAASVICHLGFRKFPSPNLFGVIGNISPPATLLFPTRDLGFRPPPARITPPPSPFSPRTRVRGSSSRAPMLRIVWGCGQGFSGEILVGSAIPMRCRLWVASSLNEERRGYPPSASIVSFFHRSSSRSKQSNMTSHIPFIKKYMTPLMVTGELFFP